MSTTYDGHETWIRFGKQVALGSACDTGWNLWDTGEADSLVFNETPDDRGVLWGKRGKRRYAKRRGMQLPGGGLPVYPWNQDGSAVALSLILKSFWQKMTATVLSAGASGTVYRQTFESGTQMADTALTYMTLQKSTGISGSNEQYLDCLIDSIVFAWDAAGKLTIAPSVKSLTATHNTAITGTGTPIIAGFVVAPNIACKYNGNAFYPANMSLTLNNTLPDRQGPASRGRQSFHLGAFTGQVSMGVWRDSDTDTYFRAPFDDAESSGTFSMTWTIDTAYGSHVDDTAFAGTITAYIAPDWLDTPAQPGDLIDTFTGDVLYDTSMSITSELDTI